MNEQLMSLVVALVGGGFLGSIVQGLFQRRKYGADYADTIARSATSLLTPLATRVDELQDQLETEQERARQLARDLDDARDSLDHARRTTRLLLAELNEHRRLSDGPESA